MWRILFLSSLAFASLELPVQDHGPLRVVYERPSFDTTEVGKTQLVTLSAAKPLSGYRYYSPGGAKLKITLTGAKGTRPLIWVEGALSDFGDGPRNPEERPFATREASRGTHKIEWEVTFGLRGVYRIIPLDVETLESGKLPSEPRSFTLLASCLENCFSPSVSLSQVKAKWTEAEENRFWTSVRQAIQLRIPVPQTLKLITEKLEALRQAQKAGAFDHGIVLPRVSHAKDIAAVLSMAHVPTSAPEVLRADFLEALRSRPTARTLMPESVIAKPFRLSYGHFVNQALTRTELEQSGGLARILNALGSENGSELTWERKRLLTVRDLFQALFDSGHQIELRQSRTHTNFLAFLLNDQQLRLPVWTDTGIPLSSGKTLKMPIGHTEYTWTIRGPTVSTRVAFFQGISGTGFFPATDVRPDWTGYISKQVIYSAQGRDELIIRTAEMAGRYLRRIELESDTVAKGLPAQGYGVTGVCNDSSAAIQLLMDFDRFPLPYPLVRSKAFLSLPDPVRADARYSEELTTVLKKYPYDADLTDEELADPKIKIPLLCRVLAMVPFPLQSSFFAAYGMQAYQSQLLEAANLVDGKCSFAGSGPLNYLPPRP